MQPNFTDENSELISARSALNTHDERKEYTGTFLTDEIPEVKNAYDYLIKAFDILMNREYFYSKIYINYCNTAIECLKEQRKIHSLVEHSIEHINAAIEVNSKRK